MAECWRVPVFYVGACLPMLWNGMPVLDPLLLLLPVVTLFVVERLKNDYHCGPTGTTGDHNTVRLPTGALGLTANLCSAFVFCSCDTNSTTTVRGLIAHGILVHVLLAIELEYKASTSSITLPLYLLSAIVRSLVIGARNFCHSVCIRQNKFIRTCTFRAGLTSRLYTRRQPVDKPSRTCGLRVIVLLCLALPYCSASVAGGLHNPGGIRLRRGLTYPTSEPDCQRFDISCNNGTHFRCVCAVADQSLVRWGSSPCKSLVKVQNFVAIQIELDNNKIIHRENANFHEVEAQLKSRLVGHLNRYCGRPSGSVHCRDIARPIKVPQVVVLSIDCSKFGSTIVQFILTKDVNQFEVTNDSVVPHQQIISILKEDQRSRPVLSGSNQGGWLRTVLINVPEKPDEQPSWFENMTGIIIFFVILGVFLTIMYTVSIVKAINHPTCQRKRTGRNSDQPVQMEVVAEGLQISTAHDDTDDESEEFRQFWCYRREIILRNEARRIAQQNKALVVESVDTDVQKQAVPAKIPVSTLHNELSEYELVTCKSAEANMSKNGPPKNPRNNVSSVKVDVYCEHQDFVDLSTVPKITVSPPHSISCRSSTSSNAVTDSQGPANRYSLPPVRKAISSDTITSDASRESSGNRSPVDVVVSPEKEPAPAVLHNGGPKYTPGWAAAAVPVESQCIQTDLSMYESPGSTSNQPTTNLDYNLNFRKPILLLNSAISKLRQSPSTPTTLNERLLSEYEAAERKKEESKKILEPLPEASEEVVRNHHASKNRHRQPHCVTWPAKNNHEVNSSAESTPINSPKRNDKMSRQRYNKVDVRLNGSDGVLSQEHSESKMALLKWSASEDGPVSSASTSSVDSTPDTSLADTDVEEEDDAMSSSGRMKNKRNISLPSYEALKESTWSLTPAKPSPANL